MSKERMQAISPDRIPSILSEYGEAYKRERQEPFVYQERKLLQGIIALAVLTNSTHPVVVSLVNSITNEGRSPSRVEGRLPHINEAIIASREIGRIAKEVSAELVPISRAVIQFGSATWGAFYSTDRDSDVDLEVVLDEFDTSIADLPLFDSQRDKIIQILRICSDRDLDMLLFKTVHQDRTIMLHFIPEDKFERFMSIDLLNPVDQRLGFRELRNYFNNVLDYTDRCSFTDDRRTWRATYEDLGNGWHIIEKPVYQFEEDTLYNGILTEWHLTPLAVAGGDEEWVRKHRDRLFREFVKRMIYEEEIKDGNARFSNVLERKHRMPKWLLDDIDQESERVRFQISL